MEVAWAFTLFILGVLLLLNLYTDHRVKELLMALADDLRTIEDQLNKAKTEVTDKIEALEGALATSGEQTQEVTDAVAALKAVSQNLDDVVPDVPVEEVVEAVDSSGGEIVEAVEAVEEAAAVEEVVETEAAVALGEALEAAEETPA
jgi:hypothetical protein